MPPEVESVEKFAWLCAADDTPTCLNLATGSGFCTMKPHPQAYATVAQLRARSKPGCLLSATALVSLVVGNELRFVMLQRDAHAPVGAGKWQFPAGRASRGELPLTTACRELDEEVGLRINGTEQAWGPARIRVGGKRVHLMHQEHLDMLRGRFVYVDNTYEFFYPMRLDVPSFSGIELFDKEPYGRRIELLSVHEVVELRDHDEMTEAAAHIWDAAVTQGCLLFP